MYTALWRAGLGGALFLGLSSLAQAFPVQSHVSKGSDEEQIREAIIDSVRPFLASDLIEFRDDFVLELTSRANHQRVYVNFRSVLSDCSDRPDSCGKSFDAFMEGLSDNLANARRLRGARDAQDDSLVALTPGSTKTEILIARSGENENGNTAGNLFGKWSIPIGVDDFNGYVRTKLQLYTKVPIRSIVEFFPITIGQDLGVGVVLSRRVAFFGFADIHRWCYVIPGICDRAVHEYIQARARELQSLHNPADRNRMMAFLALRAALASGKGPGIGDATDRKGEVVRGFVGNLMEVCRLDRLAKWDRDLETDVSDVDPASDAGLVQCNRQTKIAVGAMGDAYRMPNTTDGVGIVRGDDYESSRLLFVDEWRPLALSLGGLLVAAPASNIIIFSKDTGDGSVQVLLERAKAIKTWSGNLGLSGSVLRWSEGGWVLAADEDAALRLMPRTP